MSVNQVSLELSHTYVLSRLLLCSSDRCESWQRPFASPQGLSYSFHDQHLVPLDKKGGVAVQSLSRVSLFVTPKDCSMPGFPVLHCLPKFAQTHVGDAIQPSHPVFPFSSCPQSFPASGTFLMSQLFVSGGQSIGASASESVLPMNIQDWFPLGLTDLIFLQSKGLSRVFSSTTVWKCQLFGAQHSLCSNSHIHTWLLEKP